MRVGVLGGTFDPVHLGHIFLAKEVIKKLVLDKVIFMPAASAPLRQEKVSAPGEDRYQMLKFATGDSVNFEVSRFEIDKGGISFTVDTLEALKGSLQKEDELFFIAGSDVNCELSRWKDFDKICKLAGFILVKRPDFQSSDCPKGVITVDINALDISSSKIRKLIRSNRSYDKFVSDKVYRYIKEKGLYKNV
ncbi:MAG: nicotinate-nucleotide adenylyltransferase [Candidatus Omnitrophica bacterium]|nr:nicotinate-nucleotide adenylyltransferase [Candidatus Omnitrophota bacterium]